VKICWSTTGFLWVAVDFTNLGQFYMEYTPGDRAIDSGYHH
jgi:hypothetical protein